MSKEVIIIGAGGHGKVIADIVEQSGDKVFGFLDDNASGNSILNYPLLGKTNDCLKFADKYFMIAIGNNQIRKTIAEKYPTLRYYTAVHPKAVIAGDVVLGEGTCVMAGAIINTSARIGKHCIINSASVIEHDNSLSDYVHISPGAVLCGTVSVGKCSHIGGGAVIKNNISVAADSVVGVGAAVVDNIAVEGVYVGVPAKRM